jgi:phage recombination protein Bet
MTTDLTRAEGSALAIRADQGTFDSTQIAALRALGAEQASPADLTVYFHYCQRTGLDPFARQIYLIGRNDRQSGSKKWTIQTSIDGLRLVARRATDANHGTLGYEDTLWCGEDGQWTDVWLSDANPKAAKVTVLRDGQRFTGIALWKEYKQSSPTWTGMPSLMLAKCAEALALRKAFPNDLAGLYTDDEGDRNAVNEAPSRSAEEIAALTEKFKDEAVALAGNSEALVAVYQDARAEGVLGNTVTHLGNSGPLGELIVFLRDAKPPAPEPDAEPAAEEVTDKAPEPDPVIEDAVLIDGTGEVVAEPAPKSRKKPAPPETDNAKALREAAAASWDESPR